MKNENQEKYFIFRFIDKSNKLPLFEIKTINNFVGSENSDRDFNKKEYKSMRKYENSRKKICYFDITEFEIVGEKNEKEYETVDFWTDKVPDIQFTIYSDNLDEETKLNEVFAMAILEDDNPDLEIW